MSIILPVRERPKIEFELAKGVGGGGIKKGGKVALSIALSDKKTQETNLESLNHLQ